MSTILQYLIVNPRTNALIKIIFSITYILWTDEENTFFMDTIRSIIIVRQRFKNNISCLEFHKLILKHLKLLYLIRFSGKYAKLKSECMQSEQSSSKWTKKFEKKVEYTRKMFEEVLNLFKLSISFITFL